MPAGAYTPNFEVYKNGDNITAGFQNRSLSIKVELAAGNGSQDTCTIIADDRDNRLAAPLVGEQIEVYLGYDEVGMSFMGTFEIDEVNFAGPPETIMVHGNSMGFATAAKSPTVKNYDGKTVKEIIEDIAKTMDVQAVVDQDIGAIKLPYRNSTVSPMHLLSQLEREFGGVASIGQGRLSFAGRDSGLTATGMETPLVILTRQHMAQWNVRHMNRSDYTSVTGTYRDPDTNTTKTVTARSSVPGVLGQGEGSTERPFAMTFMFPTKEQAQKAADSQMKALDRALGEGTFVLAQGDPWIRDQNRILVIGMRDGVAGSYVADIVAHSYSKDTGLVTEIRTTAPGDGTDFAPLYADNPNAAIAPGPGQVTGEVRPQASTAPDPRITAQ